MRILPNSPTLICPEILSGTFERATGHLKEFLDIDPCSLIYYGDPDLPPAVVSLPNLELYEDRVKNMFQLGILHATLAPCLIYQVMDSWSLFIPKDDPKPAIRPFSDDPRARESIVVSALDCYGHSCVVSQRYLRLEADGSPTPRGEKGASIKLLEKSDSRTMHGKVDCSLLENFFRGVHSVINTLKPERSH